MASAFLLAVAQHPPVDLYLVYPRGCALFTHGKMLTLDVLPQRTHAVSAVGRRFLHTEVPFLHRRLIQPGHYHVRYLFGYRLNKLLIVH